MTVIIDNTGFSVDHWARFTEAEFIAEGFKNRLFKEYAEDARRELLKQAYQIIHDTTRATKAPTNI